jgi:hypothetical protein
MGKRLVLTFFKGLAHFSLSDVEAFERGHFRFLTRAAADAESNNVEEMKVLSIPYFFPMGALELALTYCQNREHSGLQMFKGHQRCSVPIFVSGYLGKSKLRCS